MVRSGAVTTSCTRDFGGKLRMECMVPILV